MPHKHKHPITEAMQESNRRHRKDKLPLANTERFRHPVMLLVSALAAFGASIYYGYLMWWAWPLAMAIAYAVEWVVESVLGRSIWNKHVKLRSNHDSH